jgi:hypothetical protein
MAYRLLFVAPFLVACGNDAPPPSQQGVVGPSGGMVTAGESAAVAIPSGALTSSTTITLTPTEAAPPMSTVSVGTPYVFGPEGTQFAAPVTVTLEFSANLIPSGLTATDIVVYTAPANTTDYQALATTVVDAAHVSAQTTHFSTFLVAVRSPNEGSGADAGIDAPPSMCVLSGTGTSGVQQCYITSNCNGHSYSATCTDLGTVDSYCFCYIDKGQPVQVGNIAGTCSSPAGQPGWGACGFP